MSFVHVAHGRYDVHRAKRLHSSDSEDHLLSDPHLFIAAVKRVGDVLIAGSVLQDVAIEQVQRDSADLSLPDLASDRPVRKLDKDTDWLIVLASHQLERHLIEVVLGIDLLLPTVVVEALAEVASRVEEADPDERYSKIACRL